MMLGTQRHQPWHRVLSLELPSDDTAPDHKPTCDCIHRMLHVILQCSRYHHIRAGQAFQICQRDPLKLSINGGPIPGKVLKSTSKMSGKPWRSLWGCQDQEVNPKGLAGAVQPCITSFHNGHTDLKAKVQCSIVE